LPVSIDRTSFSGPARITSARWTMMNPASSIATMKWTDRALCRPPKDVEQPRPRRIHALATWQAR
jgi:hypothetical protein